MKVGDQVMCSGGHSVSEWDRIGLVLGWSAGMVLVFWGEDFSCEPEYPEQLVVVG